MERVFVINEDEIEPLGSSNEDEVELPRFTIDGETNRQYRRFGAEGTQLAVRLLPHEGEDSNPIVVSKWVWGALGFRLEEGILSGCHHATPTPLASPMPPLRLWRP